MLLCFLFGKSKHDFSPRTNAVEIYFSFSESVCVTISGLEGFCKTNRKQTLDEGFVLAVMTFRRNGFIKVARWETTGEFFHPPVRSRAFTSLTITVCIFVLSVEHFSWKHKVKHLIIRTDIWIAWITKLASSPWLVASSRLGSTCTPIPGCNAMQSCRFLPFRFMVTLFGPRNKLRPSDCADLSVHFF